MSRKNFKVATAKNGKTPKSDIKHVFKKNDKTPVGKVKSKETADERRKKREEDYKNFRINALKRHMKRLGIPEEEQGKYVEKLIAQLEAPNTYGIQILFLTGQKDKKQISSLAREAILNSKIEYKLLTDKWAYIVGDANVLDKIREIMKGLARVYPYVMKAKSILPAKERSEKKPSNNSKDVAAAAKAARKGKKVSYNTNRARRSKTLSLSAKRKKLAERKKAHSLKTIKAVHKKPLESLKKASKSDYKQAA